MIVKRGNKWEVRSEDGRRLLGSHPTKESAEKQLAAIEASKHRKGRD